MAKTAATEKTYPQTTNPDGKRVPNSGTLETVFIVPSLAFFREDWKTFSDTCDQAGIHPNDKLREMVQTFAPSTL